MSAKWIDATSRSRGDTDRTPRTYVLRAPFELCVTRHIHFPDDAWVLHCEALGFHLRQLKSLTIEEAQGEAIELVRKRLEEWTLAIGGKR